MTRRTSVILSAAKNLSLPFFIAGLLFILVDSLPVLAAESKSDWKGDWDKTVQAAKKEGQLTVYFWGSPLILEAGIFQKAYPEIKVATVQGMGTQLMQRVMAARRGDVDDQDFLDPAPALQVIKKTLAERKN